MNLIIYVQGEGVDMASKSNNQDFENLCMSFELYKNIVKRAANFYRDNFNDEDVLQAIDSLEIKANFLTVKNFFHHYKTIASEKNLDFEWSRFFNYFDLLDALIVHEISEEKWRDLEEVISQSCSHQQFSHFSMLNHSVEKLKKLSGKIFQALHKQEDSSIVYPAEQPLEAAQDLGLISENLAYNYFLADQDQEIVDEYLGLEPKNKAICDSANFYFNAAMTATKVLYKKCGHQILDYLHYIWYCSYVDRIDCIEKIKGAIRSANEEDVLKGIDFNYFFTFEEFLSYWWQFPRYNRMNATRFNTPTHANVVAAVIVQKFGKELEQDVRNLYCYFVQIEGLIVEYLLYNYYVRTGKKAPVGDFSISTAIQVSGANFS